MPKKILSPEYKRGCAELVIVHGYKYKDSDNLKPLSLAVTVFILISVKGILGVHF